MEQEGRTWTVYVAQDRDKWQANVSMQINFWVP